jgi:predicted nucleic acid-binding protein
VSPPPIVVDASAAIALIRREPAWPALAEVLHASAREAVRLLAPEAFWLEIVNVLVRRHRLPPSEVVEALREMDDLDIGGVPIDRPLLLVTIDLQTRFGLSAYDAAYLAVAESENARLLTLDRQLSRAAGPRAIRLPGLGNGHLSEEPATYGEPVEWARFGAYLGKLRAEIRGPGGSTPATRTTTRTRSGAPAEARARAR